MTRSFGTLDDRGRAICPRCGSTNVLDLGGRLYRCQHRCRDPYGVGRAYTAGEREFRIRADDARAHERAVVKARDDAVRARARADAWMERYGLRPRTQSLRVLRPSREVTAAWRAVRTAKRTDSFTRRAQTFVNVLDRHVHDVERGDRDRYPLRIRLSRSEPGKVREDRSWTRRGTPNVIVGRCSSLGLYEMGLAKHRITIRDLGSRRLDEMRHTLIHEVQHWLDTVVEIDDEAHGRRWRTRLAVLHEMFPPGGRR